MTFLIGLFFLAGFMVIILQYWERLMGAENAQTQRWFWIWFGKGVGVPVVMWLLLGAGVLPGLPSLFGPAGGSVRESVYLASGAGMIVISSHWAAITLGWLIVTVADRIPEENRPRMRGSMLLWSVLGVPFGGAMLWTGGWAWLGMALVLWLLPIAHSLLPLREVLREKPMYATAIAKMKFGKFNEAEQAVIQELDKRADDFEGWMMLAEMYANHFHDLPGAMQTIRDLIDQPNVNASEVAVALHRLADWHLLLGEDPFAARQALEIICRRFPGSHLDKMARQRIGRMPVSVEALREQRNPKPIRLPHCHAVLDGTAATPESRLAPLEAAAQAERCVRALEGNPDDVAAREKLARLLADPLGQPRQGIEQLELLLGIPRQPPEKMAEWLTLIADWLLRHLQDTERSRKILQRVTREFGETAPAFDAQRRLCLLDLEAKWRAPATPEPGGASVPVAKGR